MSIEAFSAEFADAIEVDPQLVNGDTVFKDLEIWDSLAVLVVIAMSDAKFGATINGDDIKNASTVTDLYSVVQSRQKK
jgi:acyl carrier protein